MASPPSGEKVAALKVRIDGAWVLDHAQSEPMGPLLSALGVPWLVQGVIGWTTPTWDILLDDVGFTHDVKGSLLSNRKNVYTFAGPNAHVAGDGASNPASIALSGDGAQLVLTVHDAVRGEITTVFSPSTTADGAPLLTGVISLKPLAGGADVTVKRVFVRRHDA